MLGKLDTAVGAAAEQGAEAGNTQAPRETAAMLLRGHRSAPSGDFAQQCSPSSVLTGNMGNRIH